jgi:hypothetical protein
MKPETKQKQPEQKTQQPETHGINTKDNSNNQQIQTQDKELLRRKSGVDTWRLKCQTTEPTYLLTGALAAETLAYFQPYIWLLQNWE